MSQEQKKHERVRIVNDGRAGYATTIADADTGEAIPGVHRIDVTIDVHGMPEAVIHTWMPALDIVAEAVTHAHCPYCKQVVPDKEHV